MHNGGVMEVNLSKTKQKTFPRNRSAEYIIDFNKHLRFVHQYNVISSKRLY